MEKEINNREATVEVLRHDQIRESAILSGILKEKKEAEEALLTIRSEAEKQRKDLIEFEKDSNFRIDSKKEDLRKNEDRQLKNTAVFKEKEREAMKNLSWLNDKILKAEEEEIRIKERIKEVDLNLQEQEKLILDILSLQNEKVGIEKERDLDRLSLTALKEETVKVIEGLQKEVAEVAKFAEKKKEEADASEYRKKHFDDEYFLKVSDLEEYYLRISEQWKLVFPDKNMPMIRTRLK